jgi:predicted AAA+ superfamily ATPase
MKTSSNFINLLNRYKAVNKRASSTRKTHVSDPGRVRVLWGVLLVAKGQYQENFLQDSLIQSMKSRVLAER